MADKTAVVLGGTVPHAEVIRQLKSRGYRTVLIDYFDNPPAKKFADIHVQLSAMDYDSVLETAKKYNAELVMSPCLDQQMNIAMKVSEELNLSHPFSSETALAVTDKKMMKKIMIDNNIPTARYLLINEGDDLSAINLNFPLIIKPADSCGSAGISVVDSCNPDKLDEAVKFASEFSRNRSVIVEEYIVGTEMSVHFYIENGNPIVLQKTCKISEMYKGITMQLCNIYLPDIKPELDIKLHEIAKRIVKSFKLPDYGPFFMQVIVRNDEVFVIEFSPRIGGGTSSGVIYKYNKFNIIGSSIDSYLSEHHKYDYQKADRYIVNIPLFADEGILGSVEFTGNLKEITPNEMIVLKEKGDKIDWKKPSNSNVVKFVLEGDSIEEICDKVELIKKNTQINDVNGKSMLVDHELITKEVMYRMLKPLIKGA